MIDTHAHIYSNKFKEDIDDVLDRAKKAGVSKIFMPNIDSTSIDAMMALEEANPGYCIPMMGLHPCSVNEDFENELAIVESWLDKREFAAVGEIGLDLYWDKTFFEQQKEAFKVQSNWARKFDKPIVVHVRESMSETIDLLRNMQDGSLKGIIHCFTGNLTQAEALLEMGFYLGIGGVSTFKNGGLDKVIPHVPLEKLVLETDCPYLSPVPFRGKRNEPSYVPYILERVATLKDVDIKEVDLETTKNALAVFGDG